MTQEPPAPPGTAEIIYLPRRRPGGARFGAHRGRDAGGLGTFRDQVPFLRQPDARRIDLRASLRDPFEGIRVRRFEARTPVPIWVLVDLSASMAFSGAARRMELAGQLCEALAASATRIGDAFGLIGCDHAVREDLFLPATRLRGPAVQMAARVARAPCRGAGAEGLLLAPRLLGSRPGLVFLVSDFRWPEPLVEGVFAALGHQDVVPVLLWDEAEAADLPAWGLVELDDLEGAGRRLVLMRPALRRRWIAREAARLARLRHLAGLFARPPFRLAGRFDADALSRHLLAT
ncbi:DUF58 domain-containing protein [Methylobacterium sp. A54F]